MDPPPFSPLGSFYTTTLLKSPPETKKIPNDQPTQLFGSILVELPPKVSKSGNERVLQKLHFCPFLVDFHSARLFFACYGFFLRFSCSFLCWGGMGDEHGSILSFCILGVFAFWPFLGTFWALFWVQWPFGHS